jgi:lysozyme
MAGTLKQRAAVAAAALTLSAAGVTGIVKHEGMVRTAYVDPVGVVTICAGHTRTAKLGQRLSAEECERLLREDARLAENAIKRLVRVPVTQNQYDALVSWTFNFGEGKLATSTLLRKINANDCWGAGAEFPKWNKGRVKGQLVVLPGLVKRRADERAAWESGCSSKPQVQAQAYAHDTPTFAQA